MPDTTQKRIVKSRTSKKTKKPIKRKTKKLKPVKKGRWTAISREIEAFVSSNADNFKIIKSDKRSFLIVKSVYTTEIWRNNNSIHQPFTKEVEGLQYKCMLVIDGLLNSPDEMTTEYAEFGLPIIYISLPEEVKYKLSDYR